VKTEVTEGDESAARAAHHIAGALKAAVAARGRATAAFSGGSTGSALLSALAGLDVPWTALDVLQVDERVAPAGHRERNLTAIQQFLVEPGLLPIGRLHAMPVGEADLHAAATAYAHVLDGLAGHPPILDVVHLGLGADGHTASLIPGSPLLDESARHVAVTAPFNGWRRITLTLPVLSAARRVVWLVRGATKAAVVKRLVDGDRSIPAGRVEPSRALLVLDGEAAAQLPGS
jgi:6-phosphogluconolactonase